MTEETLFREALAQPIDQRSSFLAKACAGKPELRAAVEALLAAHEKPGNVLDCPPEGFGQTIDSDQGAPPPRRDPNSEETAEYHSGLQSGTVIVGRYKLVEKIGEGGMGEVWFAKQTEPVKRRVALKLIKTGMDSKAVLQRFEQERQALAIMEHPNIARVLDGGMTPNGQPFFVMELVNGLPLTKFCDEAQMTPAERLELFVPICQAVQHAHQKGIVHRDLKPANILVTMIDGKPVPKVIDFGVAKATFGKLTADTMSTNFGAVVGTLEYMSPEQAGFSAEDIDTRADIYSLGVILYELLTGLRPIDAKRMKQAAFTEMIRIIREEEPSKPSTRLSTADSLASTAALRHTDPKKLMALLRGELDWVVMKCLEKQRDRRYETANALARDIQRYLTDEPVEARPPSATYRLSKFLRRNRGPVIAASLLLLALLFGMVGTTWGLFEARKQKLEADRQTDIALHETAEAETARAAEAERAEGERRAKEETQRKLQQNEKGIQLLAGLLKVINPRTEQKDGPPLYEQLLDKARQAADQLNAESVGDSIAVAELQQILGATLMVLGDPSKAIEILNKAIVTLDREIESDHATKLTTLISLGGAYQAAGNNAQAIETLERCTEMAERILEPDDPYLTNSLGQLAMAYWSAGKRKEAMKLYEQIRAVQGHFLDDGSNEALTTLNNMGLHYRDEGQIPLAIELLERARDARIKKLGSDHTDTLATLNNLALAYSDAGRLSEATEILEQVSESIQKKLGTDHPYALTARNSLARKYHLDGRVSKAIALFENLREPSLKRFGPNHPGYLVVLNNLAMAYLDVQRNLEAIVLLEQVRNGAVKALGAEHLNTLSTTSTLGRAYQAAGKSDAAIELLEQIRVPIEQFGPDHVVVIGFHKNLALAYQDVGRLAEAIQLSEQVRDSAVRVFGIDHPNTLASRVSLASAYQDGGRSAEAFELYEQSVAEIESQEFSHPSAGRLIDKASLAYEKASKFEQAEEWRRKWLSFIQTKFSQESLEYADALGALNRSLHGQEKWDEAETVIRESLLIREKLSPDSWNTFHTKSMLGDALLAQHKFAEAEPLLLTGYEEMKTREESIPQQDQPFLAEAVDRLIELYTATEKPDEVTKWQAERENYPPAKTAENKDK